mmetsp:Transcript_16075/g.60820  ORF Transcript_16075/g.60820 Transcript_16075/m.60820 type:complete len:215 (+) Transcript_16075:872-1516(+)
MTAAHLPLRQAMGGPPSRFSARLVSSRPRALGLRTTGDAVRRVGRLSAVQCHEVSKQQSANSEPVFVGSVHDRGCPSRFPGRLAWRHCCAIGGVSAARVLLPGSACWSTSGDIELDSTFANWTFFPPARARHPIHSLQTTESPEAPNCGLAGLPARAPLRRGPPRPFERRPEGKTKGKGGGGGLAGASEGGRPGWRPRAWSPRPSRSRQREEPR